MYTEVRRMTPQDGRTHWVQARDALFRTHSQSPIPTGDRPGFLGLEYWPYDPGLRVVATVEASPGGRLLLPHSGVGSTTGRAFGIAHFEIAMTPLRLTLYWLDQYGGGVLLPFRDTTSGTTTYGGGRYLLDTAKGADLGHDGERVILDFNFAYHPSCVHDPRWSCPLAPPEGRLPVPIHGGERLPTRS
ncbi:MAG: DUF1684 domain-containing protein [Actinobacteria bacterium]|nr:DUF1684 domain-containing protein [Actinomycetota bacterium]